MFRQTCAAALVALAALGSFTLATAQEPKAASGAKQITNSVGMKLTLVPSGEFKMGSGESAEDTAAFFKKNYGMDFLTADSFKDEHPQHRVRITKPFYLGTYHVTRGQFRQFVKDSGYKTDAEKGDNPGAYGWNPEKKEFGFNKDYSWRNAGFEQTDEHPVVNVSWNDAVEYCKWLSKKEGKTYRLPTEAEWEYACRAGTTTRYYSGDDPETLAKVGNVADAAAKAQFPDWPWTIKANDGYVFTTPAGKFKPNAFGLYDMHGNAWQWCADWYGEDYYMKSPTDDPTGPSGGSDRVIRGGGWNFGAGRCRSAYRYFIEPGGRSRVDYKEILSADDFAVFVRLREARKQLAGKDAVPVYAVCTNEHLAEMAKNRAATIADLKTINGFGDAKAEKYGEAFLTVVREGIGHKDETGG